MDEQDKQDLKKERGRGANGVFPSVFSGFSVVNNLFHVTIETKSGKPQPLPSVSIPLPEGVRWNR